MLYKGIDIYEALVDGAEDGIFCISLVEEPAVERNFMCFSKEKKAVSFAITGEEKHLITGVVMLANSPIYRREGDYEYYLTFSEETIRRMAEKMLSDKTFNNISLQHNGIPVGGCNLVEVFIKDEKKGIAPNFIEDIPDGSLLATFHIEDEELWNEIKNGNMLNGFSLEGLFTVEKMNNNKIKKNKEMSKNSKITKFVKSLMTFGEVSTDKGTLYYAEDEIAVGVEVFVDGDEEKVIAEDGEYVLEDKVIVVKDGKVAEINEKEEVKEEPEVIEEVEVEAEEETAEETEVVVEPEPEERDENAEKIAALEEEIAALKADFEALRNEVAELVQKPVVEPIVEEFEKAKSVDIAKGMPKGYAKAAKLFSSIKK